MALFYTLYPRPTGSGSTAPLAPAPGTVNPVAIDGTPTVARFRLSDVVNFPPTGSGDRITDNDYIVLEARIFKFAAGTITSLIEEEVKGLAGVRLGVAVATASSPVFQQPGDVELGLKSPHELNSNPFPPPPLPVWVPVKPLASPGAPPDIGSFHVQYSTSLGVFRIHIDPHNDWARSHALSEAFNLELIVENSTTSELRVLFTAAKTTRISSLPAPGDDTLPSELFQPWLHLTPTNNFALVPPAPSTVNVPIFNFGTGPAILSGSFDADTAFSATAGGTVNLGDVMAPGTSGTLGIRFTRPTGEGQPAAGEFADTFTLSGDPNLTAGHALHNNQLRANVAFGQIELILALDGSGSMASDPAGRTPAPGMPRRWDLLKEAAHSFLGIIRDNTDDTVVDGSDDSELAVPVTLGVVAFPRLSSAPGDRTSEALLDPTVLTDTVITNLKTRLDGLSPRGNTPMGEGLQRAIGMFSGTAVNQQSLILMSDGASNGVLDPTTLKTTLDATFDDTIAVMYGEPGSSETNKTILENTVGASDVIEAVGGTAAPDPLNKAFSKIAADIAGLTGTNDPLGKVTSDQPVAVHDFTVSEFDRSLTIWVGWSTFSESRLRVELISPRCELILPQPQPGVRHRGGNNFQTYYVSDKFLKGLGGSEARYGTWRLVVRLVEDEGPIVIERPRDVADDGETTTDVEQYEYNIWTRTRLDLNVDLGISDKPIATGQAFAAQTILTVEGIPVRHTNPVIELEGPSASSSRFLASTAVSPDTFEQVRKELEEQGINDIWAIKSQALAREGKVFDPARSIRTAPLIEQTPGVYHLVDRLVARVPGSYSLRLIARGELRPGAPFRREIERVVSVVAEIDPSSTTIEVRHDLKQQSAEIVIRPFDAFGNPILFDPKLAQPFRLRISDADVVGPLLPQLDGSYLQRIQLKCDAHPTLDVLVRDEVVLSRAIVVPFGLIFANKFDDYLPGANHLANEHHDPEAVLGPLGEDASFLSLGASGSIVLGVRHPRLRPSSVSVFVQPDSDLRAYKVEARKLDWPGHFPHPHGDHHHRHDHDHHDHDCDPEWIEIGRSQGVSETFSFGPLRGKALALVRITDLSGRSIARPGQPLKTPGVSIQAVGFKGGRE